MDERRKKEQELQDLQSDMRELEIRYERYFAGVEKREPQRDRMDLARRIRKFTNQPIFQTDVKFRYQGLATRFHTYSQYWDRILRLMDEGKYHLHLANRPAPPATSQDAVGKPPANPADDENETDKLLKSLTEARQQCGLSGPPPSREKVDQFLAAQKKKVRDKFGDRTVDFVVDTSSGKPQIKVRLKKG